MQQAVLQEASFACCPSARRRCLQCPFVAAAVAVVAEAAAVAEGIAPVAVPGWVFLLAGVADQLPPEQQIRAVLSMVATCESNGKAAVCVQHTVLVATLCNLAACFVMQVALMEQSSGEGLHGGGKAARLQQKYKKPDKTMYLTSTCLQPLRDLRCQLWVLLKGLLQVLLLIDCSAHAWVS